MSLIKALLEVKSDILADKEPNLDNIAPMFGVKKEKIVPYVALIKEFKKLVRQREIQPAATTQYWADAEVHMVALYVHDSFGECTRSKAFENISLVLDRTPDSVSFRYYASVRGKIELKDIKKYVAKLSEEQAKEAPQKVEKDEIDEELLDDIFRDLQYGTIEEEGAVETVTETKSKTKTKAKKETEKEKEEIEVAQKEIAVQEQPSIPAEQSPEGDVLDHVQAIFRNIEKIPQANVGPLFKGLSELTSAAVANNNEVEMRKRLEKENAKKEERIKELEKKIDEMQREYNQIKQLITLFNELDAAEKLSNIKTFTQQLQSVFHK